VEGRRAARLLLARLANIVHLEPAARLRRSPG
jgi:hypothetical protein